MESLGEFDEPRRTASARKRPIPRYSLSSVLLSQPMRGTIGIHRRSNSGAPALRPPAQARGPGSRAPARCGPVCFAIARPLGRFIVVISFLAPRFTTSSFALAMTAAIPRSVPR
jgi:hypothetical protein